jgi:hypothetical protein
LNRSGGGFRRVPSDGFSVQLLAPRLSPTTVTVAEGKATDQVFVAVRATDRGM